MSESSSREQHIERMAERFAEYLSAQTAVSLPAPQDAGDRSVDELFSALDAALDQMVDLASVYGSDPRFDFEPLVLPAAALAGEYYRRASKARWLTPETDPNETLLLELADGQHVDLTIAVRATLLSGKPNLQAMMQAIQATLVSEDES